MSGGAVILPYPPSLNRFVLFKILIQEGVEINTRIQLQCFPFSVQHDLIWAFSLSYILSLKLSITSTLAIPQYFIKDFYSFIFSRSISSGSISELLL